MGQLEKYGLYVLCLVIFLILGVTIWGDPDSSTRQEQRGGVPMRVNAAGLPLPPIDGSGASVGRRSPSVGDSTIASLLKQRSTRPISQPKAQPKVEPKDEGSTSRLESLVKPEVKPEVKPIAKPVIASATRKYTVRNGDIIGKIAQKQLGSTKYVRAIRELNPSLRNSDNLRIGQVLVLPASSRSSSAPAAAAGAFRTYKISKNDTFTSIALLELKSEGRYLEIEKLNPNVNPRRLVPGQSIKLPLK